MKKQMVRVAVLVIVAMLLVAGCSGGSNFARGTIKNNVYSSKFSKLTFTKPDKWEYATDEELAKIMKIGEDTLAEQGVRYNKKMLELQNIYDVMVTDKVKGDNIIIMYENLAVVPGGTEYSEEQYIEAMKKQLKQVGGLYKSATRADDVKLGTETYKVLSAKFSGSGVNRTQYYMVKKIGNYMSVIIFTSVSNIPLKTVVSYFS